MDADIEKCVRICGMCQDCVNMPPASALHPWEWPYLGPIQGKWILAIVDAHSKYKNEHIVSSPSSAVTERMLRCTFATHLRHNASSFTSKEFSRFCALDGIKHVRCAPYHHYSNGLAVYAVQTIKSGF